MSLGLRTQALLKGGHMAKKKPIRREVKFKVTMIKGSSYRIGKYRFSKEQPSCIVDFCVGKILMGNDKFVVEELNE